MGKWLKIGITTVAAVVLLVAVLGLPVNNWLSSWTGPLGSALTSGGSSLRQQISSWRGGDEEQELQDLRSRLIQLRLQLAEMDRLKNENDELRQELEFTREVDFDTLPANVVNYQPDPTRSMLRINVGTSDGIETGMPVVADGALIGVVDSVAKRTADVLLLGDTDFRALAMISGPKTPGVIKGQIGDGLTMEQLPRSESVEDGDIVVTSGLDGVYPRGLLIGSISSISEAPGSVFMVAQVDPTIDPRQRLVVTVIRHD